MAKNKSKHFELKLVPMLPLHVYAWLKWRLQPSTAKFNPTGGNSISELTERIKSSGSDLSNKNVLFYRWTQLQNNLAIGTVVLSNVSWDMGYGEIGYMLSDEYHGQGIGNQMVKMFVDKIYAESSLRRLIAFTSDQNIASWHILERLGFIREGLLREHYLISGSPVNEFLYGILKTEWKTASS